VVRRTVGQPLRQFLLPALDGLLVQPRDLREQTKATMSQSVGFHRHIPTPLLFIQAAQQEIHLLMKSLVGMLTALLAVRALAGMNA